MTLNLCASLPPTGQLQEDRLNPAGEPMDQEEAERPPLRRWSSPHVTFSFCGVLLCVDFSRFGSGLFCRWTDGLYGIYTDDTIQHFFNSRWMICCSSKNVQHGRHRGTSRVSASCGLETCFSDSVVLILCMEYKEWTQLTQWQTEGRFFVGETRQSLSLYLLFFHRNGSEDKQKDLTEPRNGQRLDKPPKVESARTKSILICKTKL